MSRLIFLLLLSLSLRVNADDSPTVFRGATIHTAEDAPIENGVLVVADGKIVAVGTESDVEIPENAETRDVGGKVIIPGLVDTHSHLGVYSRPSVRSNSDGNEMTGPVQSMVRALDSLNPYDPGIRMANAGGVTTANVMPGSGNVIGGQTIYVKLRGYTPEQMLVEPETVLGGLKMANGENPKRSYGRKGQAPGTRMKLAAMQRAEFLKAQDYKRKWDAYRAKAATDVDATPPEVDLGLEPLVEVLEKRRTVHFHTHRADDILTTLRLKKEFGFELVIQHGTESFKVLDAIAEAGVPVSMTVLDSPGGKQEVVDLIEECGAELASRGVKVLINTDDPVTESRFLLRTVATAVRGGLDENLALKSVTLHAAEAMHLDHRLGSLAAGKDADFVILSGPPFSVYTRVLQTFIDGESVFDWNDETQQRYQVGGFHLQDSSQIPSLPKPLPTVKQPIEPAAPPRVAQPKDSDTEFVVLAGRLYSVASGPITNGAVYVKDGKIVFAGPQGDLPDGAKNAPVLTAATVTPGLIDAFSVVPLNGEYNIPADQEANEKSDPNQADVRALDAFNPGEPLLRYLLEQGVTVVHACPGDANVIAGATGVFRTHGTQVESMTLKFPYSMLFNLGDAPKQAYDGKKPQTRMGTAALLRQALNEAVNYQRKLKLADKDSSKKPDRNLKLEALADVVSGKTKALFAADRADDLLTALRLIKEFQLDGELSQATEAYLVADEIKQANVPVFVHPVMQRVGGLETINSHMSNPLFLAEKEIPLALTSGIEYYVPKTRVVRYEAAMAAVYGLGVDRALRAVTLDAAKLLGIDKDYGSLEAGKVADIVLYDGDPFEHATHVTRVVVDGQTVYDRTARQPIPFAHRWQISAPAVPCCNW
ncbi:amidohydrolase family protein [Thalassoroseus pseudoceratinae]|uniref:amidohydrolase family protein n=1 Tax=Thalassoroseus pseudoceratinae TaxID=2713176 RepID=UPI00142125E7|nr:amidohydrolase family protein [Thalassoroseus pseudoceratinae]